MFETWSSTSIDVQAIQLTDLNLRAVAEHCGGRVSEKRDHRGKKFVILPTRQFQKETTVNAFVGDWVVKHDDYYICRRDKTFRSRHMEKNKKYTELLKVVRHCREGFAPDEAIADRIFGLFATGEL